MFRQKHYLFHFSLNARKKWNRPIHEILEFMRSRFTVYGSRFRTVKRNRKKNMCMRKNHDFRFTAQYAMEAQIGLKS